MNIAVLEPELQRFIQNEVASGRFQSENDLLSAAVRLLRTRQIHELRKELQLGVDQLDRGDASIIANDEELAEFFDEIADEVDRELEAT